MSKISRCRTCGGPQVRMMVAAALSAEGGTTTPRMSLEDEIAALLNRHSEEGESDTPDFVLAEYLMGCLEAFHHAVRERSRWYRAAAVTPPVEASSNAP